MKETGMRDCADWVFVLAFFLLGVILALAGIHMFNTRINRKTEACAHVVMAVSCVCLLLAILNVFQGIRSCPVVTAEDASVLFAGGSSSVSPAKTADSSTSPSTPTGTGICSDRT